MYARECWIIPIIVLSLFIGHLNGENQCLASNNQKWSVKRGKCVDCKLCPPGKARISSETKEPSVVSGRNTRCLPCRVCPDGFYASENHCLPCRVDCVKDYNRNYNKQCEESHDAQCGSCLVGFEDALRDINLPCSPKEKTTTPRNTEKPAIRNENDEIVKNYSRNTKDTDFEVESSNPIAGHTSGVVIGLICVGLFMFTAVVIVLSIKYRKQPCNNTEQSIIEERSGGVDNDLQIDGGGSAFSSQSEVRGELPASTPLIARPELSSHPNFGNTQPLGNVEYQPILQTLETQMFECGCRKLPDCQCYVTDIPDKDIQISDEYISIVSRKICHSERQLYKELKLDPPEIYATEDDRRMDPDSITLGDKVLRLLNRWVEKRPTPVTLHTLMKALCKSHFHNINKMLIQKFSDATSLENDNGGIS